MQSARPHTSIRIRSITPQKKDEGRSSTPVIIRRNFVGLDISQLDITTNSDLNFSPFSRSPQISTSALLENRKVQEKARKLITPKSTNKGDQPQDNVRLPSDEEFRSLMNKLKSITLNKTINKKRFSLHPEEMYSFHQFSG